MARAWRNNNENGRRLVALQNLKNAKFFEKNYRKSGKARTQEEWAERVANEIAILEKKVNL
jgi:hypothetical protein